MVRKVSRNLNIRALGTRLHSDGTISHPVSSSGNNQSDRASHPGSTERVSQQAATDNIGERDCGEWGKRDSNPHALRHMILSHARLPIPTFPRAITCARATSIVPSGRGLPVAAQRRNPEGLSSSRVNRRGMWCGRNYAPQPQPCWVPAFSPVSKLCPQAQPVTAFGLRTVKPPPMRLFT
jgi:hypothetical protein